MNEAEFKSHFKGSAVRRAKYAGFMRNALIVAANSKNTKYLPQIKLHLASENPLIKSTAWWAYQVLDLNAAKAAAQAVTAQAETAQAEHHPWVLAELKFLLVS